MKGFGRVKACIAMAGMAVVVTAWAAPADDHARARLAYSRGDVTAAMATLRPLAAAGYAPSQVLLAFILDSSDFPDEAAKLYADAAAQDDADGHAGLANAYLTGRGVAKDEKRTVEHFSKAAELGHAKSIESIADIYLRGLYGQGDAPADVVLVAVRRAADNAYLPAMDALAAAHLSGRWGVPVDAQQSAAWSKRSAEERLRRTPATSTPRKRRP